MLQKWHDFNYVCVCKNTFSTFRSINVWNEITFQSTFCLQQLALIHIAWFLIDQYCLQFTYNFSDLMSFYAFSCIEIEVNTLTCLFALKRTKCILDHQAFNILRSKRKIRKSQEISIVWGKSNIFEHSLRKDVLRNLLFEEFPENHTRCPVIDSISVQKRPFLRHYKKFLTFRQCSRKCLILFFPNI